MEAPALAHVENKGVATADERTAAIEDSPNSGRLTAPKVRLTKGDAIDRLAFAVLGPGSDCSTTSSNFSR